jgi:hypothetical protein
MRIKRTDSSKINSQTGVWERHVLGDLFQTANDQLHDVATQNHRLRIFSTPHGLAVIKPTIL